MPRSGNETIEGMVWLPRMLDKARRVEEKHIGRRVDGYLFGNSDFVDGKVLRFLRIDDTEVSALVREHGDDATVARIIVERSGRSVEERREYSQRLKRGLHNFLPVEADEGRIPPGPKRTLVRLLYRALILPYAYNAFRKSEQRR